MKESPIRYRSDIDPKPPSRTDWDRVDGFTDEDIETNALSDPDAQPLTNQELAECFRPGILPMLRQRLGLDQADFARRFCIDLETLRAWEDGRSIPANLERAYLRVIGRIPEAVLAALGD